MNDTPIEIAPDIVMEPFFKSLADYEEFRQRYIESVGPSLEKARRARALSEHESRNRLVR